MVGVLLQEMLKIWLNILRDKPHPYQLYLQPEVWNLQLGWVYLQLDKVCLQVDKVLKVLNLLIELKNRKAQVRREILSKLILIKV